MTHKFGFHPVIFDHFKTYKELHKPFMNGLQSTEEFHALQGIFGRSSIKIERPNCFNLFIDEVLTPFYLFQYWSLSVWIAQEYYNYTWALMSITFLSIVSSIYDTLANNARIRKIAEMEC